jgi:hypothetical protein
MMNANLSVVQQSNSSMTKIGGMPIKTNYDGPAPLKDPSSTPNTLAAKTSVTLPKPGFF